MFALAMRHAFAMAHYGPFALQAPFVLLDKGEIVALGLRLGVPFHLTWTCYAGDALPCGKCGSCVERAEAFAFAGAPDPLLIQGPALG